MTHLEIGLPAIIDYYNYWQRNARRMDEALVVRYEGLRSGTAGSLRRLAAFLEEDFDEAHIQDAVSLGSFENVRILERSNYFDNCSLSPRNASDLDTRKVRRGGGYRDDLSHAQARELEEIAEKGLDPDLGYGKPARTTAATLQ